MARLPSTWIKLDRNLKDWEWAADPNTLSVFIHLLLRANVEDKQFKGAEIKRGDVVITQEELASATGLTRQKIRRALDNLISTKSITKSQHGRMSVISILRYNEYQGSQPNTQPRNNHETTTTKELKNKRTLKNESTSFSKDIYINNNNTIIDNLSLSHSLMKSNKDRCSTKPYHIPTITEVQEYERTSEQGKDPKAFYKHYEAEGWRANGKKVYNWQKLYDNWQEPEKPNHPRHTDDEGYVYEWDKDKGCYKVVERPKRNERKDRKK